MGSDFRTRENEERGSWAFSYFMSRVSLFSPLLKSSLSFVGTFGE